MDHKSRFKTRDGMASIELLFIFTTFVLAMFTLMKLGMLVIHAFFNEGNHLISLPMI